jgi:xylan 1,4-beta-xylosidase
VTGAFVGMAGQDLAGTAPPADFDWFEYRKCEYALDDLKVQVP